MDECWANESRVKGSYKVSGIKSNVEDTIKLGALYN